MNAYRSTAVSRVERAVETVEKVPFQKMIAEKWDRNTKRRLIICAPNNILASIEPVVVDFL